MSQTVSLPGRVNLWISLELVSDESGSSQKNSPRKNPRCSHNKQPEPVLLPLAPAAVPPWAPGKLRFGQEWNLTTENGRNLTDKAERRRRRRTRRRNWSRKKRIRKFRHFESIDWMSTFSPVTSSNFHGYESNCHAKLQPAQGQPASAEESRWYPQQQG